MFPGMEALRIAKKAERIGPKALGRDSIALE
jgi:hypothetical protein